MAERKIWTSADFWIFGTGTVRVETPSAELTITQRGEIAVFERRFAWLQESAGYGQAAWALIATSSPSRYAMPSFRIISFCPRELGRAACPGQRRADSDASILTDTGGTRPATVARMTDDPLGELLGRYMAGTVTERADLARIGSLVERGDPWCRSTPLHVTPSAVIVHPPTRRVLLRWHARQHAWLHVGGHGDPGR
jgi:hypothetical protein